MGEKNKKHILRKILFVIFIVFIIFFILTLRKVIIFNKIENVSKDKLDSVNYYIERISIQGNSTMMMKSYNKDNNYFTEIKTFLFSTDEKRELVMYQKDNDQISIMQSDENKIAYTNQNLLNPGSLKLMSLNAVNDMKLWQKLLVAATSRITSEKCNNKECYLVEPAKEWKLWIDKETGLVVREINGSLLQDSYYKFNEVTDEDIVKPDISDCKIIENN